MSSTSYLTLHVPPERLQQQRAWAFQENRLPLLSRERGLPAGSAVWKGSRTGTARLPFPQAARASERPPPAAGRAAALTQITAPLCLSVSSLSLASLTTGDSESVQSGKRTPR